MARLDRSGLLAQLADGVTVVTPSRRLARDLKREFDRAQVQAGRQVWPAADVLPWSAWLARCVEEVDPGADRPMLLTPLQQQYLWRQIVRRSRAAEGLVHVDALAQAAEQAWTLLQQEGEPAALARSARNEDHLAFDAWAGQFSRELRRRAALSPAQLPAWLAAALARGAWRPTRRVAFAGFDRFGAQPRHLREALAAAGFLVESALQQAPQAALPARVECSDARQQWQSIARWARARLQADPQARIGIVVPDLGARRAALVAALTDALAPALRLAPDQAATRPFNLSLGTPLAQVPLVETALALFDLMCAPLELARATRLLRSPFLAAGAPGEAEWTRRARLDRALRDDGAWEVGFDRLRRAAGRLDAAGAPHPDAAPLLAAALARAGQRLAPLRRRPHALPDWVTALFDLLRDLGFPGSRTLDSVEFQAQARLRELIAGLAALDAFAGPASLADTVALLRRMAAETLFQAETPEVPVQVLGVIESRHLQFDHLWVADLSEAQWPPEPQPNPLLPLALQRAWQLPGASAELALARAQQAMADWADATGELVYSHAALDGDRPCLPSPLISSIAARPRDAIAAETAETAETSEPLAVRLRRAIDVEAIVDGQAPPCRTPADMPLRGGTRVFADQSACAFRAFATHRLHAQPLAEPEPGLDAAARGGLLHDALAAFWVGLGSQAALRALTEAALHQRVVAAASAALDRLGAARPDALGPALRALEQERLLRAVHAWLEIEDARPPFTVLTLETAGEVDIGGLRVAMRPDRVDRLDDGSLAIIDYKTGGVTTRAWLDTRPDQPQLPLYATAYATGAMPGGPQPVGAIAFAQLRPGQTRLAALAARDGLLPDAQVIAPDAVTIVRPGWDGLLADWRDLLAQLAQAFLRGDAAVAPKRLPQTCEYCGLALLCRRHERAAPGTDWTDGRAAEDGDD